MWTYLPYGPFDNLTSYRTWLEGVAGREDPMFFAIIDGHGRAVGVASFLRTHRLALSRSATWRSARPRKPPRPRPRPWRS